MPKTVRALVIRENVTGESTRILTLLTEEGILRAFAHGARKPGSPLAACCSLFSYSELVLSEGRSKDTWNVKSGEILSVFRGIFDSVEKLSLCSYFAELCQVSVPADAQAEQFLRLFLNSLYLLSQDARSPEFVRAVFQWKILELSGYMPGIIACRVCGAYEAADICFEVERQTLCCGHHPELHSGISLPPAALTALRHILLAEPGKIFSFSVPPDSLLVLTETGERSVQHIFEQSFPTLSFYRSLLEKPV